MSTSSSEQEYEIVESNKVQLFNSKVVAADLATAVIVGCSVAVPISIIDFAIMSKVGGLVPTMGHQVKAGLGCLFKTPQHFFLFDGPKSKFATVYHLCATVYVGTYIVANWTRSFSEGYSRDASPESVATKCGVTSSVINVGLTIWKDSRILEVMTILERMAGKNPATAAAAAATAAAASTAAGASVANGAKEATEKVFVPMLSRLGFAVRDTCTCVAAFTVVPLLKDFLYKNHYLETEREAQTVASLFTPCSIQVATTAIHIPSIIYQRMYDPTRRWSGPEGYTAGIMKALKADYAGALRMRVLRICLAFGIGGIGNAELRPRLLKIFEPKVFQMKKPKQIASTSS